MEPVTEVGNVHAEFRSFWHPIAWSPEVTSTSLFATTLLDEPLVAWRDDAGVVRAALDECPHRGAPLSLGRLEPRGGICEVVCGFHGWRFSADGPATLIPSLGENASLPARARLTTVADVAERHGIVWAALEPPRRPIIDWPDGDDDTYSGYEPTAHTSRVLAAYQTDNLLDASHFPFLHPSLSARNPRLGEYETIESDAFGFRTVARKLLDDNDGTEGWLRYTCAAPFTVLLRSEEPDGSLRTSFLQAVQPIDALHTRLFFKVRVPKAIDTELAAMQMVEEGVQREDVEMNAALRRTGMRLGAGDLHVRTDRNGVLYRQIMQRLLNPTAADGDDVG